jgi:hypothetical protein
MKTNKKELIKKLDSQVELLSQLKAEVNANVTCSKISKLYKKVHGITTGIKEELEQEQKDKLKSQITFDLEGVIPRIRELSEEASNISMACDSIHESFSTHEKNTLLNDITYEVRNAYSEANECYQRLEQIADDYEEKVEVELNRLDPENYKLEE